MKNRHRGDAEARRRTEDLTTEARRHGEESGELPREFVPRARGSIEPKSP